MPKRPNIPPGPHSRKKPTETTAQRVARLIGHGIVKADTTNIARDHNVINADTTETAARRQARLAGHGIFEADVRGGKNPTNLPVGRQGTLRSMVDPSKIDPSKLLAGLGGGSGVIARGGSLPPDVAEVAGPPTADLTKNPYGPAYDKLLEFVKTNAANRAGEYDATKALFKQQQEAANKEMYQSYLGSRTGADASATALGVDPNVVSAARDLAMRKSQENSDQSLADNLAWLDKSKMLKGDQLSATQLAIADDRLNKSTGWDISETARVQAQNDAAALALAEAAAAKRGSGGGGGGKRKGGGGSSSSGPGKITDTSTITDTLNNSGADVEAYNSLLKTNPEAAALLLNATNLQGPDQSVVKYLQGGVNERALASQTPDLPPLRNPYFKTPVTGLKKNPNGTPWTTYTPSAKAKREQAIWEAALKAAMPFSGYMGGIASKTVNTSKASQKRT